MKYPEPYFKNIANFGNLHLDYIFAEYECPILFTCIDNNKNLYFCDCVSMQGVQKWLLVPTDTKKIYDFIHNNISIRNMFLHEENVHVLTWHYGDDFEDYKKIRSALLKEDELPPPDTYLEADDGEFDDYYDQISNRKYMQGFFKREKMLSIFRQSLTQPCKLYYSVSHTIKQNEEEQFGKPYGSYISQFTTNTHSKIISDNTLFDALNDQSSVTPFNYKVGICQVNYV